jgi:hypothetical protein
MELKDFVAGTITQIVEGVDAAKKSVDSENVMVSPTLSGTAAHKGYSGTFPTSNDSPATMINFDVSLSTTEGSGTKGGIGVVTGIVSLGSSGESRNETSSLSRVQFSIPVILQRYKRG